jgi:hypothetical protein
MRCRSAAGVPSSSVAISEQKCRVSAQGVSYVSYLEAVNRALEFAAHLKCLFTSSIEVEVRFPVEYLQHGAQHFKERCIIISI